MNSMGGRRLSVLHSSWSWLPVTMNWLYSQVSGLINMDVYVVSRDAVNLKIFPINNHAFVTSKTLKLFYKIFYRFGFRLIPKEHTNMLQNHKINILHSHFGDRGWNDIPLARKLSIPHFVSFYGLDVDYIPNRRKVWKKRYLDLFHTVEKVLVLGPVMRNNLLELGCPIEKILIHHVGVNVENIQFSQRHFDPNTDVLRILIAASFREKKGIPVAIEALSRIKNDISIHITLIGDADNSIRSKKEKKKIIETIRRCEMEDSVSLLGYQAYSKVIEESYDNHIFINSSLTAKDRDTEGTPVVLMDMMANGIPVISTYHSDIPEIIQHGINGWLAKEKDVDDLERIIRLCISSINEWKGITTVARKKIENDFNNSIQSRKLKDIYLKYS